MINKTFVCLLIIFNYECRSLANEKIGEVFAWKQISYDFNGVLYNEDSNFEKTPNGLHFHQDALDSEKFFIQYNNVPVGFEVYGNKVIVTVPRRRYGIPSTLNYVEMSTKSPALKPFPNSTNLVSVYRPRIDACHRLWMVDTGLLEIPGNRSQVQKPAIVIYDLKTDRQILRYELKDTDLVNERTPGGLISITVDVTSDKCEDAFAYINDLATEGMIVFSLKSKSSWRLRHPSFAHNEMSLNFSIGGYVINWRDGLFSIALSEPDAKGHRTAFYHPLVSTLEFTVNTKFLQSGNPIDKHVKVAGTKGCNTQSGSHDYHPGTKTLFYANVAQDAILCWRVDNKMAPENIGVAVQDHEKLAYISDLKVIGDDVWVLVNQMHIFVYSTLNVKDYNFYIHKANVYDLIRNTPCEKKL
ncbi:L-dopachrome tautomerase yellow-f2-like [Vanessa atalanta]|uniref:L-dopachrome tautomerase yellow-f2-like n=1 Tax=Vanessa atalanta TaxID=42275 RepID=UPI001FCD3CDE|nr:L-dopachrome tautomerase yellow-f2-like [Vanessa atalanta]